MKKTVKRYIRYVRLFFQWLLLEKTKGLDFSMRNQSWGITAKGSNGYALTPSKVLSCIFEKLDINENDAFIDIGCGKGGVIYFASKYPFGRISGLEIETFLCEIANKNMKRLHINEKVEIINCDAVEYNKYNEFNFFYLYNPFSLDIYRTIINKIISAIKDNDKILYNKVYLICYGKSDNEAIEESKMFKLIDYSIDTVKETDIHIWKWNRELRKS